MRKQKGFGLIILVMLIAVVMLALMGRLPVSQKDFEEMSRMLQNPIFAGLSPAEAMQSVLASNFITLFLMMPLMVPVTIAAYSIVGEKTTRSLEPLLRTGGLRDSISTHVEGAEATVGSVSPIALYQEQGTEHIPPRPFLGPAAFEGKKPIGAAVAMHLIAWVAGVSWRRPPSTIRL